MTRLQTEQTPLLDAAFEFEIFSRGTSKHVEIPRGTLTLGRSSDADVHVDDASASRQHIRLYVGDHVEVEELGSANGTTLVRATLSADEDTTTGHAGLLVPGQRVRLDVGDVLRVGSVVLALQRKTLSFSTAPPPATDGAVLLDPEMLRIHELLKRAATTDISVLILGETGVGKELMAATVHHCSPRSSHPYLKLNCAALLDSLLESELFGHERGAFTGALAAKAGLFEATNGGTVFLDEIGELPLATQAKLLRVLEERSVIRVGSSKPRPIDVRFVTATNRDLKRQSKRGAFRSDLYYRVSGLVVTIPPLRKRPTEVASLARFFLRQASKRSKVSTPQLSSGALELLQRYRWPGNVRELKNVMDRAALMTMTSRIEPEQILLDASSEPPHRRSDSGEMAAVSVRPSRRPDTASEASSSVRPSKPTPRASRASAPPRDADERARVVHALDLCGGNQTRAAELLGVSRRTLVNRLNTFNLPRPNKRRQ